MLELIPLGECDEWSNDCRDRRLRFFDGMLDRGCTVPSWLVAIAKAVSREADFAGACETKFPVLFYWDIQLWVERSYDRG